MSESRVRPLAEADVPALMELLRDYLPETYGAQWHGSAAALSAAVAAGSVRLVGLRDAAGALTGFAAWTHAFDLHHCVAGGTLIDLYVRPGERGYGRALLLLAAAARQIHASGGRFIRGGAVEDAAARRLYARSAVCTESLECTLGGRAFRHLAGLSGSSARQIARSLPETGWNHEA